MLLEVRRDIERRRSANEEVIDLSTEEPGFELPRLAADAAVRSIQQGKTRLTDAAGIMELRAAAARHWSLLSAGRPVNADHIVVSTGARHGVFNASFVLFESGDRVLVPTPAWPPYQALVRLARATPVSVAGDPEWSLKVSVDDLERATDARTAGLLLSSPTNPTGAVYTRPELKAICQWARERGVWVVIDETYRRLHFGSGPAPSALDLPDELVEQVVVVSGLGKTYAMTGWRIGITIAPSEVSRAMAMLQEYVTGGASQPAQWAAAVALSDDRIEAEIGRTSDTLRRRRDVVVQLLRDHLPGVEFVEPLGAFFIFFRVDGFFGEKCTSARLFCEGLLTDYGVALAPGEAFGDGRWVRLSYAAAPRELERGLERIASFGRTLTKGGVS
jgi:aspartate aminotransferase